jgi:adenosine deaminase
LRTRAVGSLAELAGVLRKFENAGVRYTINTDGPYLLNTHLRLEYEMLIDNKILSEAEVERSVAVSRAATFVR